MSETELEFLLLLVFAVCYCIIMVYAMRTAGGETAVDDPVKTLGIKSPCVRAPFSYTFELHKETTPPVSEHDKDDTDEESDEKKSDEGYQPGDSVSHPNHYNREGLPECQELIEKLLSGYSGFLTESEIFELGNVIKYIYRAPLKNKGEDLKKAAFYMQMLTKS